MLGLKFWPKLVKICTYVNLFWFTREKQWKTLKWIQISFYPNGSQSQGESPSDTKNYSEKSVEYLVTVETIQNNGLRTDMIG